MKETLIILLCIGIFTGFMFLARLLNGDYKKKPVEKPEIKTTSREIIDELLEKLHKE